MPKFRKRPVVIEAVQYDPVGPTRRSYFDDMPGWLEEAYEEGVVMNHREDGKSFATIKTLEGTHRCDHLDWIILGVQGELYPCKPDIFAATYEPAEEVQAA